MRQNNHQYKVGDKILVNRKKNSKNKFEFMGPFLIKKLITMERFVSKKDSSMMPPIFAE